MILPVPLGPATIITRGGISMLEVPTTTSLRMVWLLAQTAESKKPRMFCHHSRFSFSVKLLELQNGGGGGSRTRVRKCSPPVSTCLVPCFGSRFGNSVGTWISRSQPVKSHPLKDRRPSRNQPIESTPQIRSYGREPVERQYDRLSCYCVVIIVCDYI